MHRSKAYLQTRIIGHFDTRLAEALIATLDAWLGTQHSAVAFHDCTQVDDYDVEARERITTWSRAHVDQFEVVHLFVEGRIIAWALRLISVAVGSKITTHHDRASFESAIARRRVQTHVDR